MEHQAKDQWIVLHKGKNEEFNSFGCTFVSVEKNR